MTVSGRADGSEAEESSTETSSPARKAMKSADLSQGDDDEEDEDEPDESVEVADDTGEAGEVEQQRPFNRSKLRQSYRTKRAKPKAGLKAGEEDNGHGSDADNDNCSGKQSTQNERGVKASKKEDQSKALLARLQEQLKELTAKSKESDKRYKKELADANALAKAEKKKANAAERENKKLAEKMEEMDLSEETGGDDEDIAVVTPSGIILFMPLTTSDVKFYQLLPLEGRRCSFV